MRNRLINRGRGEQGFTMFVVIMAMMVLSLLAVGAYAASMGDMPIARKDQDRKRAYEAAQAGVDWYLSLLRADPDYFQQCDPDTGPTTAVPLTLENEGSGGAWQVVDNSAPEAKFRVEILNGTRGPVPTPCVDKKAQQTAFDKKGRMWIRSTGVANGKVRSVLAAINQESEFLKYVLFTNWESQAPQFGNVTETWSPLPAPNGTNGGNVGQCDYPQRTRDKGPKNQADWGIFGWVDLTLRCVVTAYSTTDEFIGSVHTNDDAMLICRGAKFGTSRKDTLEIASAPSATDWNSGSRSYPVSLWSWMYTLPCSALGSATQADINATVKAPAPVLQLPPSNVALKEKAVELGAGAAPIFSGQTCIELLSDGRLKVVENGVHSMWGTGDGTQADPKRVECDGTATFYDKPSAGLIYVRNQPGATCTPRMGHNSTTSYSSSPGCGDVAIKGTYADSLTVAAENDIIITGNLTKHDGDAMLGLVANSFVRIYRPMTEDPFREANQESREGFCDRMKPITNAALFTPVTRIEAAIMSVRQTFVVDNLMCPPYFGVDKLEFEGAITTYWGTQLWACTVLNICAGYPQRKWTYDERLKTQQPPYFIAPLNSDGRWQISRRTEQVPTPVGPS